MTKIVFIFVFLLRLLAAQQIPDWIVPIPDGIQVKETQTAIIIAGQWAFLISINEPTMPVSFFKFIDKVHFSRQNVSNYESIDRWIPIWLERLRVVKQSCQNPFYWWRSETAHKVNSHHKRQKRGLFNLIGSISNSLFGTATEEQVRVVHHTLSQLKDNQQRIIHNTSKLLSLTFSLPYTTEISVVIRQ